MNLKVVKEVASEARPSISKVKIGEMLKIFEVKGAAIEASASERDRPISATFRALQSFAPSPHIPTRAFELPCKASTRFAFPSGLIQANIFALLIIAQNSSLSVSFVEDQR